MFLFRYCPNTSSMTAHRVIQHTLYMNQLMCGHAWDVIEKTTNVLWNIFLRISESWEIKKKFSLKICWVLSRITVDSFWILHLQRQTNKLSTIYFINLIFYDFNESFLKRRKEILDAYSLFSKHLWTLELSVLDLKKSKKIWIFWW